jgi:hypothetical protein
MLCGPVAGFTNHTVCERSSLQLAQKGEVEEDEQAGEDDDALVVEEDEEFDVFAD